MCVPGIPKILSVNITAVADVDDNDQELMAVDEIENAVVSHTVGITAFKFPFERLPFKRIAFKIVEGLDQAPMERWFPLRDPSQDLLSPVGELQSIVWQGNA